MVLPPEFETLPILPPPYEIFEFSPCEETIWHIVAYEVGRMTIKPRWPGAPPQKEIVAIRLTMHEEFKEVPPPYWDLCPGRLVWSLIPLLQAGEHLKNYILIHRTVPGPKAHFSIQLIPFEKISRAEAIKKRPRLGF